MLAICAPSFHQPSETFVRKHVEQIMPGRTVLLCEDGYMAERLGCPVLSNLIGQADPTNILERLNNAWWYRWRRFVNPSLRGADEARVRGFLRGYGVKAVLAEYGPTGCLLMEPCKRADIPLFVHFHGYDVTKLCREGNWLRHYRRLFKLASGIIVPSKFLRLQLETLGCPSSILQISPCGVEVPENLARNRASTKFITVGRFVEKKAPTKTLRAFSIVLRSHNDVCLEMIGDGPLLDLCIREAKRLGIEDRVNFRGVVDHEEVKSAVSASFAFVQHSVMAEDGDCEGLPVAVLEAMAAGLPVVGTRHSGIPEAVVDGETGLLTEEHDIEGMASAMLELLRNPERAEKMGFRGRARVEANFTHEGTSSRLRRIMGLTCSD